MDINVRPEMGCVRAKVGLTGQLDRRQLENYFKPCKVRCKFRNVGAVEMSGSYKHPRVGRAWAFELPTVETR